jgi:Cu+-exporting ATPase
MASHSGSIVASSPRFLSFVMPTILMRLAFDQVDSRHATALETSLALEAERHCFHCGTSCGRGALIRQEKSFCCQGCLTVFELLTEHGLDDFYRLGKSAGVRINRPGNADRFRFLDDPSVRERLADYSDERLTRVPDLHCLACVWLIENLFRLKPGLGRSQVDFPRKAVSINFPTAEVKLSEVAALLASLGYEPELKFADLDANPTPRLPRKLWLQLGVAGFAFGNTMLFSIASYLGLDAFSGPGFRKLVGFLSFGLAIPVVVFSALDYWRSAWISLRQRLLNIEVPIAAGIAALFLQSAYEVLSGRGEGYFDSLAGLLFFLLCGKLFQQKTFDRLAFDRDYKSFFPLSVTRRVSAGDSATVGVDPLPFPSPQPSPVGRGRADLPPQPGRNAPDSSTTATKLPSPWGEGQGEGKGTEVRPTAVDWLKPHTLSERGRTEREWTSSRSSPGDTSLARSESGVPGEERISISLIQVSDRLIIRNGELIPADARLVGGAALIDSPLNWIRRWRISSVPWHRNRASRCGWRCVDLNLSRAT